MTHRHHSVPDIVIIGGGHNGLVAAAYLAQSGRSVTVLERLDHLGGAAVSAQAFEGVEARLSRYSYLVSLLPAAIIRDLGLDIRLERRRYSSYTPLPGTDRGLLVDNGHAAATRASFDALDADFDAWQSFYARTGALARAVFPTVTEPLLRRNELKRLVDATDWTDFIDRPIGEVIERSFDTDLVRGIVLTDALIGTFAPADDPTLAANRCFLYHVIGGGTGDWDVPVGGMGAVTSALANAARTAGASLITGAEVVSVTPDGEVRYRLGDDEHTLNAGIVLSNVAPHVLSRLLGLSGLLGEPREPAEGAQVKVNLLLRRLPRLRDASLDPAAAFGGTFHINEGYAQLERAFQSASGGDIPSPLPAEIYCHSLTDQSILSPELSASGAQTLTVFGLHTPHRLVTAATNDTVRAALERAVIDSLDSVLAEPIEPLLLTDITGRPCIETKTTHDLELALGLPGGNIFHAPLSWPFAEDSAELGTAAERWGVATAHDRILLCGAGAQRGGGVSGLGGHNAAMAVLEG
ncbi:MAG: NAD(P)/FAD-dependent oxidoreductase [Actinomycetota bacterium]